MALVASLQHLKDLDLYKREKPYRIFANIPKDAPDQRLGNLEFDEKDIVLRDIRNESFTPTLDNNGFTIKKHVSTLCLVDYTDRALVEEQYLPQMEALLKSEDPSIYRVFFFDWRLRSSEDVGQVDQLDLNDYTTFLKPAQEVHVDQSPLSALQRVQSQLSDDAEQLLKGRVRILNLWRPLVHPVEDYPLAICNGATVCEEDLMASDHVRRHYTGETYYVRYKDVHEWFYVSEQQPDKVLILKMFDSKEDVKAKVCPHASFKLPNPKVGARPRQSIEVRALVFSH